MNFPKAKGEQTDTAQLASNPLQIPKTLLIFEIPLAWGEQEQPFSALRKPHRTPLWQCWEGIFNRKLHRGG